QVRACFRAPRAAAIYLSQPATGETPGARQRGECGDAPHRYATAKARKNYAATSPVTRQSGTKKTVLARFIRNNRLADALHRQAQKRPASLTRRPRLLRRATQPRPGPRRRTPCAAGRLVGILHGCLTTRTLYDEATAWSHRVKLPGVA